MSHERIIAALVSCGLDRDGYTPDDLDCIADAIVGALGPSPLTDLIDRLERADAELRDLVKKSAADDNPFNHARLGGKVDGVNLALSYAQEYCARASLT